MGTLVLSQQWALRFRRLYKEIMSLHLLLGSHQTATHKWESCLPTGLSITAYTIRSGWGSRGPSHSVSILRFGTCDIHANARIQSKLFLFLLYQLAR